MQPRRLLPARAVQRERLARQVERAERAALHGRDPQPHGRSPLAAATRSSPRSSITISSVRRRAARGRGRPSAAAATALIRRARARIMKPARGRLPSAAGALPDAATADSRRVCEAVRRRRRCAAASRLARAPAGRRRSVARARPPGPTETRSGRRVALGFDLDRAQPVEHAPGDHLAARPVGARAARSAARCRSACPTRSKRRSSRRSALADVGERLLAQLAAVLARHLVEVLDHHQQAAQLACRGARRG